MDEVSKGSNGMTPKGPVLALEVRSRVFGFVVLEQVKLVDWGIRRYEPSSGPSPSMAAEKIAKLLLARHPTVIVMRKRWTGNAKFSGSLSRVIDAIRDEMTIHDLTIRDVSVGSIDDFFGARDCTTKHAIASALAEWFPELKWKVPPKRKTGDTELSRALIFDALASAVVFLWNQ